jgi:hypothetical protein
MDWSWGAENPRGAIVDVLTYFWCGEVRTGLGFSEVFLTQFSHITNLPDSHSSYVTFMNFCMGHTSCGEDPGAAFPTLSSQN